MGVFAYFHLFSQHLPIVFPHCCSWLVLSTSQHSLYGGLFFFAIEHWRIFSQHKHCSQDFSRILFQDVPLIFPVMSRSCSHHFQSIFPWIFQNSNMFFGIFQQVSPHHVPLRAFGEMGGTPSNHPFSRILHEINHSKPFSYWGYPHFRKPHCHQLWTIIFALCLPLVPSLTIIRKLDVTVSFSPSFMKTIIINHLL